MRTVFVEDTESHRNTIRQMLLEIPSVQLVGEADSVDAGYEMIKRMNPELVLLDVELYPGTAFDLLNRLLDDGGIHFEVIFLTGFANFEYPIRAIQYAALDFLMKPIDKEKLREAMVRADRKIKEKQGPAHYQEQIMLLLQNMKEPAEKKSSRIAFHRTGGKIEFVGTHEMLYCEADKDVTHVFLLDGKKFTATRNLAFYARPLEIDFNFFRISDKLLINLDFLKDYDHADNYQLTLTTGKKLHASRRGGQELKQHLNEVFGPSEEKQRAISSAVETGLLKSILKRLLG